MKNKQTEQTNRTDMPETIYATRYNHWAYNPHKACSKYERTSYTRTSKIEWHSHTDVYCENCQKAQLIKFSPINDHSADLLCSECAYITATVTTPQED